jgi:hypothetical protein
LYGKDGEAGQKQQHVVGQQPQLQPHYWLELAMILNKSSCAL